MSIQVGDTIPAVTLKVMGEKGPQDISTDDIFKGKKVVLFAVPGAFTPGCTLTHLPGYVVNADKIKAKGVDTIACMAVNDAFVMFQWGKHMGNQNIYLLPDGSGEFTRKMGMLVDKSNLGFGMRSWRYSMLVDDGNIEKMFVEPDFGDNCPSKNARFDSLSLAPGPTLLLLFVIA